MNADDIKLRKVGDEEPKKLPRGVKLMILGDRAMFVKKVGIQVFPVSDAEQERLMKEYRAD
jgi:hypothetical protein